MRILYVMDPMCAWCYGFQPELEKFLADHSSLKVDWVMGGLAPDSKQPMNKELQQAIAGYWYDIEKKAQVTFNHDYWQLNTPYRSTYQACRAVIAAESIAENSAQKMVKAIQSAYYLEAKNPSLEEVLVSCASSIGLNEKQFIDSFSSKQTEQQLQQHLNITRQFQVNGFPALFYVNESNEAYPLTFGYCTAEVLVERFNQIN